MNDIFDPKKRHTRIKHTRKAKELSRSLALIKKEYKKAIKAQRKSQKQKLLCDNFYILYQKGAVCLRDMKYFPKLLSIDGKTSCIEMLCEKLLDGSDNVITQGQLEIIIKDIQKNRYLENSELNSLKTMLTATAIKKTANALALFDEDEAALRVSHAINTLHALDSFDFIRIRSRNSIIEQIFACDPSGIYPKMDEGSRLFYCDHLSRKAIKKGKSEQTAAQEILDKAKASGDIEKHIGFYLLNDENKHKSNIIGRISLILQIILPLIATVAVSLLLNTAYLIPLLYLPLWQIFRPIILHCCQNRVIAQYLPRLELKGCIPPEGKTLVAVSTLLPCENSAEQLYYKLKSLYFKNPQNEINFIVLADLKESTSKRCEQDEKNITAAAKQIERLNKEIGDRFLLIVRNRVYSRTQKAYIPWERKRGALTQLVRMIKKTEENNRDIADMFGDMNLTGDINNLQGTRFIAALDWDTDTGLDGIYRLVSCALHPLNRPIMDKNNRIVKSGYGIIAPKSSVEIADGGSSLFTQIMAGSCGVSGYNTPSSEYYMDMFGEGIFCGKGLIDIDTYYRLLNDLPEQKILSHDSVESGVLRCAVATDIEFTDSFPDNAVSWLKRNHRWIRGDFQNIPFMLGIGLKNRLNWLTKFKLFDNVRRPLTQIACLLCLIMAVFTSNSVSFCLCIAAVAGAAFENLFSAFLRFLFDTNNIFTKTFYAGGSLSFFADMKKAAVNLIMLPLNGIIAFDAALKSMIRTYITHKNMLQWVTSANSSKGIVSILPQLMFSNSISLLLLFISPFILTKLIGAITLLVIPLIILMNKEANSDIILSCKDKEFLVKNVLHMWKYFEDNCHEQTNFLPPDNIQYAPVKRTAMRTSPTNIGFMLLSVMAACDLKIISMEHMLKMLSNTISTVEKLQKYSGNLFNWYDIRTLQPMKPDFVSSVDSGNFVCCLVTLKKGLEQYEAILQNNGNTDLSCKELIQRIDKIINDTDLGIFYDSARDLFYIGIDVKNQKLTDSHYDLFMSEARLLSYYTVAKRLVPKRHWGALSRTMSRLNRYKGPVSWGGCMFEYFMPMLLLPCECGSFLREAMEYCLYCQREEVKGKIPWGISESGYYAFDWQLNYQYKAHGAKRLKLRQNSDSSIVISPYSSMITVHFTPNAAIKNMRLLKEFGAWGKYGFYEALDFGEKSNTPKLIKSYMAHHVGMSIVAIANALNHNAFQNRFISDDEMGAAIGLLKEKIPGSAAMVNAGKGRINSKNSKEDKKTVIHDPNPLYPRMHILSNERYSLHISDCGAGFSMTEGLDVTRRSCDIIRRPLGIFAIIEGEGQPFSITQSPCYYPVNCDYIKRRCEFTENHAAFYAKKDTVEATMQAALLKHETGEMRKIIIRNISRIKKEISVLLYLEPCLREYAEDSAHLAYSRMFLRAHYHETKAVLTFCVRTKDGDTTKHMAVGLNEPLQFEYECDREKILGLNGLDALFEERKLSKSISPPDTSCAIRVKLTLQPKSQRELTLLICIGETQDEAVNCILKNRDRNETESAERSTDIFKTDGICRMLAERAMPNIYYPMKCSGYNGSLRKSDLWSFGISGDMPIIALEVKDSGREDMIRGYIEFHKCMIKGGTKLELVFINGCDDDKMAECINDEINGIIKKISSKTLIGAKGGIFIIDSRYHQREFIDFILQSAAFTSSCEMLPEVKGDGRYIMQKISECEPYYKKDQQENKEQSDCLDVYCGKFIGKRFEITSRPDRIWTNILANSTFGTLASNLSLGCTWAINSRENKLTPWYNDPCRDNDGEMLILNINGKLYDMIKGSYPIFETDRCLYQGKIGQIEYTVSVKIPEKGMFKNIKVAMKRLSKGATDEKIQISYYAEPVLGIDRSIFQHIQCEKQSSSVFCENPWSVIKGTAFFGCNKDCDIWFDRAKFFAGDWTKTDKEQCLGGCVVLTKEVDLDADKFDITFTMGFSKSRRAAESMIQLAIKQDILMGNHKDKQQGIAIENKENKEPVKVDNMIFKDRKELMCGGSKCPKQYKTGDKSLDFMLNTWTVHQIKSARINGRIGFYQCSGAWGFRDQLQDSIALLNIDSNYAKRQIFRCAARQFIEGDVMHWWHELPKEDGGIKGVRTLCSDDMLWLVYAVCEYVEKTSDNGILDTEIHYIEGEALKEGEYEKYFSPNKSSIKESVFDHCRRAVEYMLSRIGEHGLPLIGNGDWNDGMNRVGAKGRGESVWLALFASIVLERFAIICDKRSIQNDYKSEAKQLKQNVDKYAWDGKWYLRGFFDDGTPLGSHKNKECKIDSLSQSFAALANMPDKNRVKTALNSCKRTLVDEKNGIIKLFHPPFVESRTDPGYIMSYPAGLRENGGQYTHAACWLALAFIKMGDIDEARRLIDMINSAKRGQNEQLAKRLGTEPYSIPADIYTNEACMGRGGWSQYTGSAGWFYRAVIELLRHEEKQ